MCSPSSVAGIRVLHSLLVIAQESVLDALGELPDGVRAIHYNALSGMDGYRDVRGIIMIGRTLPSPVQVEARAEVLTGDQVERVSGDWYDLVEGRLSARDGRAGPLVTVTGARGSEPRPGHVQHPNPMAEAVRWQICEAELLQALGRGRGVRRSADNPLQIDILTNVPLPVAVDAAGPFEAFEPTAAEIMEARGVQLVDDVSVKGAFNLIATVLPDLYPSADAARKALSRFSQPSLEPLTRTEPYILLNRKCPRERMGTGKGQARQCALCRECRNRWRHAG